MPLMTALLDNAVTRNVTCPVIFHTRYSPPANPEIVRLSSTLPLPASSTSILSILARRSQSRPYSPIWWLLPSVTFTSITYVLVEYHVDAIRSDTANFCRARTSVVDAAHVNGVPPTVTCA